MLQELRMIKELVCFTFQAEKTNFIVNGQGKVNNFLTKYRSFKPTDLDKRVSKGDIYICERHYC